MTHIIPTSDIIIQLSKTLNDNPKLLHLNALVNALATDPDLAGIPHNIKPQAFSCMYAPVVITTPTLQTLGK